MANVIPLPWAVRRSRRKREIRARTENTSRVPRYRLEVIRAEAGWAWPAGVERPKTRAECVDGVRPCPFVGCKHNMYLDASDATGAIKFNFPDLAPEEMPPERSCVLDMVESNGALTLESTGELMNMTRERVRQVEEKACLRLESSRRLAQLAGDDRVPREQRGARSPKASRLGGLSQQPAEQPEEHEEQDERSTLLLRGLNPRERDDAERFGRTAATLVLAGWRPLDAWDRANELLEETETGDPMPALFADVPAERTERTAAPAFVTPPERIVELSSKAEERLALRFVPKTEREDVDDQERELEEPTRAEEPTPKDSPSAGALPRASATRVTPRPEVRRSDSRERDCGESRSREQEDDMPGNTGISQRVLETLRVEGPMGHAAIAEAIQLPIKSVRDALAFLLKKGDVTRAGERELAIWSIASGAKKSSKGFEAFVAGKRAAEDEQQAKVLEQLKSGPMGLGDIAQAVGLEVKVTLQALRRAQHAGLAVSKGWARAAKWQLVEGRRAPTTAPRAAPARKPTAHRDTKPANTVVRRRMYESTARPEGKSNGHAPPVTDFAVGLSENLLKMRAHYEKKIVAIDALLAAPDGTET